MGLLGFIGLISNAISTGVSGLTVVTWKQSESRCSREIEHMVAVMEAGVHSCITDYPGSRSDCLDVLVL